MKKRYEREAYYLDDDILLHGYKDKRGFHPDCNIECGFDLQILNKKDIGKTVLYSIGDAISKYGKLELAGGKIVFSIDDGMAITKIRYAINKITESYKTNTLVTNTDDATVVIMECLSHIGIKALHGVTIKYILQSESLQPILNIKYITIHELVMTSNCD